MIIIVNGLREREVKAYIDLNKRDGLKEVKTYFPEADYWRLTRIKALKQWQLVIRQNWIEYTFDFTTLEEMLDQADYEMGKAAGSKVEIGIIGFKGYHASRVG